MRQIHAHRALSILWLLVVAALPGCVVAIGNSSAPPPPPAEGEVVILRQPGQPDQLVYWYDRATISEIDAARHLSFENDRTDYLDRIADRPGLSSSAQRHLVTAAFGLSFESNRMRVLRTLIANDAFAPAAKQQILERLNRLSFESNRKAILQAMLDRPPPRQQIIVIEPPAEYSPIPPNIQPPIVAAPPPLPAPDSPPAPESAPAP